MSEQGYDHQHQFVGLVGSVEGAAFGGAEGLLAAFALVAALGGAMDHYVSLFLASVCSAALVVAKLLLRVHAASLLLLTLDTSKDAS
jgi:hypothetical protein